MPTLAVTVAVYNEQKLIDQLLDALLRQTRVPDEIVLVDDGSTDATAALIKRRSEREPRIRYVHQENAGPAAARNRAFREAQSEICVFTDGDCVPDPDWIEKLTEPFGDPAIGASAGTYRTLNPQSVLASFIGAEIAWRYRDVGQSVDCHGTYNLAIRRAVLEELGGFDQRYRHPSGEDFDLTYRVSRKYRIAFVREAVVGHEHPEHLWGYLRLQARRAFDRVRLYRSHSDKAGSDSYTSWLEKYQVLAAGLLCATPALLLVDARLAGLSALLLIGFSLGTALLPVAWISRYSGRAAAYGILVRLLRNFAWGCGVLFGLLRSQLEPAGERSTHRTA
jgi:glycosyltransferase involved in cell wall biosynthesis